MKISEGMFIMQIHLLMIVQAMDIIGKNLARCNVVSDLSNLNILGGTNHQVQFQLTIKDTGWKYIYEFIQIFLLN